MKEVEKKILFIIYNMSNMNQEVTIDSINNHLELLNCNIDNIDYTLDALINQEYIFRNHNLYLLTVKGMAESQKICEAKVKEEFSNLIERSTSSIAYLNYCTELYGYKMYLFDMMDKVQLDFLFNDILISQGDSILDLGCGCGSILNCLIKKYHCQGIGIDQLKHEIIRRTNGLITYINGNIDEFENYGLFPDITISVDGLYFSNQLDRLLSTLANIKGNRLYFYYSQYIFDKMIEDKSILECNKTRLAKILNKLGISYKTIDYSLNEKNLYERALELLPKYREALELEGNKDIYEKKYTETKFGKELYDKGCASRYLYIVSQ